MLHETMQTQNQNPFLCVISKQIKNKIKNKNNESFLIIQPIFFTFIQHTFKKRFVGIGQTINFTKEVNK